MFAMQLNMFYIGQLFISYSTEFHILLEFFYVLLIIVCLVCVLKKHQRLKLCASLRFPSLHV